MLWQRLWRSREPPLRGSARPACRRHRDIHGWLDHLDHLRGRLFNDYGRWLFKDDFWFHDHHWLHVVSPLGRRGRRQGDGRRQKGHGDLSHYGFRTIGGEG